MVNIMEIEDRFITVKEALSVSKKAKEHNKNSIKKQLYKIINQEIYNAAEKQALTIVINIPECAGVNRAISLSEVELWIEVAREARVELEILGYTTYFVKAENLLLEIAEGFARNIHISWEDSNV